MRHRIPHILKPVRGTSVPTNVLYFDTETRSNERYKIEKTQRHTLWFGYALAYRRVNGIRTRERDIYFDSNDSFWSFVESRISEKQPLYCYCHNAGFDLTITDFWRRSEAKGWKIDFAVLENPPLIISCTTPYGRIHFVDTMNYFKVSLKVLGDSVGLPKLDIDFEDTNEYEAKIYCKRDVEIIAKAMDNLCDFVVDNRLGKLGSTVASLAFSAFRHRFMHHYIYIHDRELVLKMERDSYHGGMVNCNYVGQVRGKTITKLDVNSLYPTVMQYLYPTKLKYSMGKCSVHHVLSESKKYGVIADVSINSPEFTYPVKWKNELLFATGKYRTCLVGPELIHALNNKVVTYVHWAAFYEMAPIFKDYVSYFWELRAKYKSQGNVAGSTFAKYMLNSLYGKFAQGVYEWIPLTVSNAKSIVESLGEHFPEVYDDESMLPHLENGQRPWILSGVTKPIKIRKVGSSEQIQQKVGWHPDSFIAIASYVTSYARRYLLDLISLAGTRNVYYYDTDSLFVNSIGLSNLRFHNKLSETALGGLKIEGKERNPIFLAPKDYLFGSDICLKGIRKNAKPICRHNLKWDDCDKCKEWDKAAMLVNGRFRQLQFEGIRSVITRGCEPYIDIVEIEKNVSHNYKKGVIEADGWTRPYHFESFGSDPV